MTRSGARRHGDGVPRRWIPQEADVAEIRQGGAPQVNEPVDEVPEDFARAVEGAERRRLRDRSLVRSLMGWSVVALVVATPINFVLVLLGGLNASLDRTDSFSLLAADVIAALAAGSAVIILMVAPLLGRSLRTSRRAIGICRVLRRAAIFAVFSPIPVLILIFAGN